jgi:hypothetical protein
MRHLISAAKKLGGPGLALALLLVAAVAEAGSPDLLVANNAASPLNDTVLRYDGLTGTYVQPMNLADEREYQILANPAFGPDGNLYIFDSFKNELLRYNVFTAVFMDVFVSAGSGGLSGTNNVIFGPDQNLYLIDSLTHAVMRYDGHTGAFLDVFVPQGVGGLRDTYAAAFGPDGNLYVANGDAGTYTIRRFNGKTGAFLGSFPLTGVVVPLDMVFGPDGNIYVASQLTSEVRRYTPAGTPLGAFVSSGAGGLNGAVSLAFGPADGNLYVGSGGGSTPGQVLRYSGTTGAFLDVFLPPGDGGLHLPRHLLFMPRGVWGCVMANGTSSAPLSVQIKQGGKPITTITSPSGCYSFPNAVPGKGTVTIDLISP